MNDAIFSQLDFGPISEFLMDDNVTDISYSNGGQVWLKTLSKGVYRIENPAVNNAFMDIHILHQSLHLPIIGINAIAREGELQGVSVGWLIGQVHRGIEMPTMPASGIIQFCRHRYLARQPIVETMRCTSIEIQGIFLP